ncbi:hypothetical protein [Micromonospora purpureochromogenes]|uniref:Uncharacterized protein n=1 Tax=Micromonospora purpureochromogenes TaxID=47872 RepID=A0ABX2RTR9_9ACTN|nr:hypothetical protein [Micromonospora purpureochromogenes]NYF59932.1 hypothetical protein [Micromonospora purpureochromogenes]
MLDRWVAELKRLAAGGGPVMLPFDFSDECTGWLRVGRSRDDLVEVQAGWSRPGQYDFNPSQFVAVGGSLSDFEPVRNARIERPLTDVIAAVTACRDRLTDHPEPDDFTSSEDTTGEAR